MVVNFTVFKKSSPNGRVALYMGKREFVDSISTCEPIDGIVVLDDNYVKNNRKVYAQLVCNFRYGREDNEVMGLNFQKELTLATVQIHPQEKCELTMTTMQERLLKKLGQNAFPFVLTMPSNSPSSVVLQQKAGDESQPVGLQYFVKVFAGDSEIDRHRRSTVSFSVRKVQYAPAKQEIQPCTIVRKDFLLSPGELELEVNLDKQLYHHGEKIAVNICVRNNSNKVVKRIRAMVQQGIDFVLFQNGQLRTTIASLETTEGCPIQPGSSVQKTMYLLPSLISNQNRAGIAIEGQVKRKENTYLASSTLLATPENRDAFGIIVSYSIKVKLFLGAMGGELCAELPFVLMQSKPADRVKQLPEDFEVAQQEAREEKIVDL